MACRFAGVIRVESWTPMLNRNVEFIGPRSALARSAQFSWGSADSRNVGLVRITTDEGIAGIGKTSVTFPLRIV
jgi:L-alanine-DL-glutamate epimerase-like enolase superfamily enzyme